MQIFTRNQLKNLGISSKIKFIEVVLMSSEVESDLARIELRENVGPFELFTEWMEEFKTCTGTPKICFNLAVASSTGEVANCTIGVIEMQSNGFIFATKRNSRKAKFITENPNVATCFFWHYAKNEDNITRQVRMQGTAIEQTKEDCEAIYQLLPTSCKIRDIICDQGREVRWEDLKKRHDELLEQCQNGKELKMPDTLVAYKIVPKEFDFYYSVNSKIADRILFKRECCKWKYKRVCA